ncbi:protein jagunal 1 isoform X1 [Capsicum galapagoense]
MNQRTAIRGRPSGTDGSDFSYRMVVDSRYTKVAKAKSRLAKLIFSQVVTQLMIAANVFVSLSKNESPDRISISSLVIGFVSIVAGELGRKKSRSSFLKFYVVGSSMAILLSVAYLAMSNLQLESFQNFTSLETLKVAAVLLGFLVQLFAIGTTVSLVKNMAPPKRAS